MKLKSQELSSKLQQGSLPAAILLYGQEQGLIEEAARQIEQVVLPDPDDADFDRTLFFGADLQEESFFSACQAMPFMANKRFIWVKNGDKIPKKIEASVVDYLKSPAPDTLLLITAGPLEARSGLRKSFEKSKIDWVAPYYPLEGRDLPGWIGSYLQKAGYQADRDAILFLTRRLEGDTMMARPELDKLVLYMGQEKSITLDHTMAVVGETAAFSAFALATESVGGHLPTALHILDRLLDNGEEPLKLLALIIRRLRQLIEAKSLLEAGEQAKSVTGKMRIFWKEQNAFLASCRQLSFSRLLGGVIACQEADVNLKGGAMIKSREVMEQLILKLPRS